MSTTNVNNWGREIVPVIINGSSYTASAGAVCRECAEMFGAVTVAALARYGVNSELWQVALAFWYHNFPGQCGDWSDIPAQAAS